jgi:hypothetical protein
MPEADMVRPPVEVAGAASAPNGFGSAGGAMPGEDEMTDRFVGIGMRKGPDIEMLAGCGRR